MKFIHFSDTHLGFSDYYRIDPVSGINQREQDFYNAWFHIVERIIKEKPEFVVHAGDLFHTTRPTNRAIAVALEGIQKICDSDIPFIIISGNHSTPKIKSTGSIFESIELQPNAYAAYKSKYEKFKIKDCTIHCIPHCSLTEELEAAFKEIDKDQGSKYNILMTHGAWAGEKSFSMGEFNEQHLPDPEQNLKTNFDYIALGHYHKYLEIKPHVVYSGSAERTSFNEANNSTGYVQVDLKKGEHVFVETPSRPMQKLAPIDCRELTASQIYEALKKESTNELKDALVSIHLNNVNHDTLIKLENREIETIFQQVFYLNTSISQITSQGKKADGTIMLGALPVEFERYIDEIDEKELDKERLKAMGLEYLTAEI